MSMPTAASRQREQPFRALRTAHAYWAVAPAATILAVCRSVRVDRAGAAPLRSLLSGDAPDPWAAAARALSGR
jgi:hypothetical protein